MYKLGEFCRIVLRSFTSQRRSWRLRRIWLGLWPTKRRGTRSELSTRRPYKSRRRLFWRMNSGVPRVHSSKSAATMLQRCDRKRTTCFEHLLNPALLICQGPVTLRA